MIDINEALLEERLTALEAAQTWSPRVVSRLEVLIRSGDDYSLFRINPLRYATEQGVDDSEAIDLFLQAATVGLFEMEWLIVCGACANVFSSFRKLENLDPHFVCSLCSMENEADLDDYIQVAFTISPQLRPIVFHEPSLLDVDDLYFRYQLSGEVKPLSSGLTVPEVLREWTRLLTYLDPGESTNLELDLSEGVLGIVDVLNTTSAMYVVQPSAEAEETALDLEIVDGKLVDPAGTGLAPFNLEFREGASFYADRDDQTNPDGDADGDDSSPRSMLFTFSAAAQIPAGHVSISLKNATTKRASVWVIEYPPVPEEAAFVDFRPVLSAKRLLSNQTFRRLFRSETVPVSESLKIKDLTFLFSDLKDSTLMYELIGDVSAYDIVRRHFDALVQSVTDNSGALVKTIGDAIMATFVSPVDGVRAALDMRSALAEFSRSVSTELSLKMGIHRGHSIAVNLNDRIDYFGQTVNVASRVQQLAGAGDIVISGDVYRHPGVSDLLASFDVVEERGIMKGVEEVIPVFRISGAVSG